MAVLASVASTTSAVTLVESGNTPGVSITNTDANILYVLIGAGTVSATNHTVALATGDYFETPWFYRGEIITGLWAGDGSGVALITRF